MYNPIEEKQKFVQSQIHKSFNSGINVAEEIDLEKAHKDGDHHPTKPWVWVSSANGGKGDWRVEGGRAHKKAGASTTDVRNGNNSIKAYKKVEAKKDSFALKTDYKSSDVFQVSKEEWEVGSSKDKCKISFFNTETSFAKNMVIKYVDDNGKDAEIKISGSYGKDHPIPFGRITDDFVENVRNGKEDVSRMYFEGKTAASKFALKFLNNRGKQSKKSDQRDKIAQDAGFKDYAEMKDYQDYVTMKNLLKKPSTKAGMRLLYQQEITKYEKDHANLINKMSAKQDKQNHSAFVTKTVDKLKEALKYRNISDEKIKKLADAMSKDEATAKKIISAKFPSAGTVGPGMTYSVNRQTTVLNGQDEIICESRKSYVTTSRGSSPYTTTHYEIYLYDSNAGYKKTLSFSSSSTGRYPKSAAEAKTECVMEALFNYYIK